MGFRHYVHYAIAVLAIHASAWLCRVIVLSGVFAQSIEAEDGMARVITIFFSLIVNTVFCILSTRILLQDGERRRAYLALCKERTPRLLERLSWMWRRHLIHIGLFAVFQLPFLAFYSRFQIAYVNGTILDSFYILEAGFYELFGHGVVGFLLHNAFLFVGQCVGDLIVYHMWEKEKL